MAEGLRRSETCPLYLHPVFAERVMGYPEGWTDCEDSETPLFRKSPPKSSDA
jgi:hypothetical protein